ncbi:hypothetical protein [Paraburkholderia sp. BL10I2N1]|uniref:hypothetical protein n=1 Tax=Paraburkholderia sp. BL10I2N1 TaxID=1938796 RepID=UPI00105F9FA6|nr:hypothetical protein [Paraburkholderia sp. BL10I2N1]TDN63527.1 hypothetical protein B0G77_7198 [Paraburkholderia sp. BL10I2N1]
MKLSTYLALMAFSLSIVSVATHAQISQTYRFGEGQTTMQPGNAHPTQPRPPTAPDQQPQPKAQTKHELKHHRHYRHHVPAQDMYSHG